METCPVCGAMMALHDIEQVSRCGMMIQLGRIATALEAMNGRMERTKPCDREHADEVEETGPRCWCGTVNCELVAHGNYPDERGA